MLRLWPLSSSVATGPRVLAQEGTFRPWMAMGAAGQNILVVSCRPCRAVLIPLDGGGEAAQRPGVSRSYLYKNAGNLPFTARIGRRLVCSAKGLDRWSRARQAR